MGLYSGGRGGGGRVSSEEFLRLRFGGLFVRRGLFPGALLLDLFTVVLNETVEQNKN